MKSKDTFFETFCGEFIEIVQDFEVTTSFKMVDDTPQEIRMPMTVNGFLMDSDGVFVYLSPDGENVTQALPIDTIKYIAIVDVKDAVQEALDDIPEPSDSSGYN